MKTSAFFKYIPHLKSKNHEIIRYALLRTYPFVIIGIFIVIFSSCEKDVSPPRSDRDLLTSAIWGEENICGWDSDPDIYTHIFESGGRYLQYHGMYQILYGATWSLKDNGTLIFYGDEFKILTLNENILKIRPKGGICISTFQALKQTKALTVGVTALSKTSARLHGFIRTSDVTDVSFEYGTSTAYGSIATPDNNLLTKPSNNMVNITLSGLLPETIYHYRIKAVNSFGTYYGQDQIFKTFNTLTLTDADNNIYNTITIGSQTWMTENLKTTKYNDGSTIPLVMGSLEWTELSTPGYCWYNNDSLTYKNSYGGLFNWATVNTGKLCPTGWHVPDDQEWITLIQYVGEEAGSKLTEGGYDLANPLLCTIAGSYNATNESGFSALCTGMRDTESNFFTYSYILWSSTEDNLQSAWGVEVSNASAYLYSEDKKCGLAVRCIKD